MSSTKGVTRFIGLIHDDQVARFERICAANNVGKAALVEVMLHGLSDDEAARIIAKGKLAREEARKDRPDGRRLRAQRLKKLTALPADKLAKLEQLLEQVE